MPRRRNDEKKPLQRAHEDGDADSRPGGEDEGQFESTTHDRGDKGPYPNQADWPRRQHVGPRAEGPGQREHDRDMSRSYGSGRASPRRRT